MTITYRDAIPADSEAIARVFRSTFVDTFGQLYRPEDLSDFLSSRSTAHFAEELGDERFRFRLAEDDGVLAGYIKLGPPAIPVETPPDTIELNQLYLLRDYHGLGIAASLMEWALTVARASGARHIQLSVYVDNHRGRRFYERYGFHAAGRYDFMVGSHADPELVLRHVVMQVDQ